MDLCIVLDFKEDQEIPILLGRPFFATSRSTIDLEKNELIMKINGETEVFKCNSDPQKKELGKYVKNNCYYLSLITPNNLDQGRVYSLVRASSSCKLRERNKCKDSKWIGRAWKNKNE